MCLRVRRPDERHFNRDSSTGFGCRPEVLQRQFAFSRSEPTASRLGDHCFRCFGRRPADVAKLDVFHPPCIRAKLVDNATRIEAARLLTHRAAALKDHGARMSLEAAMAKLYSSEIAVRMAEDGVQIHGGYGFVKDYPAEKFFRDVKLTTIGEGTSEVQRLVIARQLLAH